MAGRGNPTLVGLRRVSGSCSPDFQPLRVASGEQTHMRVGVQTAAAE